MTAIGWLQIILFSVIIVALTKPLGAYMTRVFSGERTFLSPVLRPVETGIYWIGGVDERREQHWLTYTVAMLLFHVGGVLIIYGLMRLQAYLPFNPAGQTAVAPDLSFNTAISFIIKTNWKNYGGESTLSKIPPAPFRSISLPPRPAVSTRTSRRRPRYFRCRGWPRRATCPRAASAT